MLTSSHERKLHQQAALALKTDCVDIGLSNPVILSSLDNTSLSVVVDNVIMESNSSRSF